MSTTHTPGPWHLDTLSDGSMIIQPSQGFSICPVTPRQGFPNDIPNFKLMARAPEMLELIHELTERADIPRDIRNAALTLITKSQQP